MGKKALRSLLWFIDLILALIDVVVILLYILEYNKVFSSGMGLDSLFTLSIAFGVGTLIFLIFYSSVDNSISPIPVPPPSSNYQQMYMPPNQPQQVYNPPAANQN